MAVIDALPGVTITINISGAPLEEHCDADIEEYDEKIIRFIEATPNQHFTVNISIQKGTHIKGNSLKFVILADGKCAQAIVISREEFSAGRYTWTCSGPSVGKNLVQRFQFSNLEIADNDDASTEEMKRGRMIGSLRILVYYANTNRVGIAKSHCPPHMAKDIKAISRKAIKGKGISQTVSYSAPQEINETYRKVSALAVPGYGNPVAVFEFRYRSKECLKSMLLIPRSPSPLPLGERAVESLSNADIQALQRHYQATKDQKPDDVKLKRERADNNPRPRKLARPYAGSTQLEIDEEGNFREKLITDGPTREVVDLD